MASNQQPIKAAPKPFRFPVPDEEDMYNVSPFPDFDDAEKVQQYIQDRRVIGYDPLVQPALLRHEIVSSTNSQKTIASARYNAARILAGHDDRVLVVVGPCSIHCPEQAIEYAKLLKSKLDSWPNLLIIMRAYFEVTIHTSPHLINIDGSFKINRGLRIARQLLCDLTDLGIPVGSELLDTISPQYIADLISWGAIGARTTESQLHRELASGTSFPIGFKNGTDGSVTVAIDAMHSASNPHAFMGVTEQGLASIVKTRGNKDVHVILRGGTKGPNYASEHVKEATKTILKKREWASIMIDCSHGNSQKNHNNQPRVIDDICAQLAAGEKHITGVMIESHINEGRQDVPPEGPQGLKYGVSITDACVDWDRTVAMLDKLNEAVCQRRKVIMEESFSRPAAFERAQAQEAKTVSA
ncbi:putative stereospecific condensation of phosphoenolpyruvate (PEP) and D-erythrose-4-phosphate (E4P) giving rise to 3-deoxy-D-arabino-heptulosonate-7-phosphate (DAHP) [Lyophyllum shimeji]|uniref:3-deoxy-7-phosphoheptulonate synthase n=1 Tax=Lyophyllum shimeji TaxID=47721 RepID=A0A9P3PY16_LYOSH|nr:putative stereospecific condensation of phosphoenolpyruvate (PEP) and D-erythrose-4-phosphate (E4P) giving rise to 3-deoxy-D-arabino-heptulosonate-7-phosphate (DAHP) [Lyophyllum shimeji]